MDDLVLPFTVVGVLVVLYIVYEVHGVRTRRRAVLSAIASQAEVNTFEVRILSGWWFSLVGVIYVLSCLERDGLVVVRVDVEEPVIPGEQPMCVAFLSITDLGRTTLAAPA